MNSVPTFPVTLAAFATACSKSLKVSNDVLNPAPTPTAATKPAVAATFPTVPTAEATPETPDFTVEVTLDIIEETAETNPERAPFTAELTFLKIEPTAEGSPFNSLKIDFLTFPKRLAADLL